MLARRRLTQVAFLGFLAIQVLAWYVMRVHLLGKLSPLAFLSTFQTGVITPATLFWLGVFISAAVFGPRYCSHICAWGSFQDFLAPWAAQLRPSIARPARLLYGIRYSLLAAIACITLARFVESRPSYLYLRLATPPPLEGLVSPLTLTVVVLTIIMVRALGTRAWCRYACPWGAAIGLFGLLSGYRIRLLAACTGCGVCTGACPKGVEVARHIERRERVSSPDCTGCQQCAEACPQMVLGYGREKKGEVPGAHPGLTGV